MEDEKCNKNLSRILRQPVMLQIYKICFRKLSDKHCSIEERYMS